MDNVKIYKREKFQLKIPYNIGCAKIIKSDIQSTPGLPGVVNSVNFQNVKICQIFYFFIFVEPRI
jgi:hypothetical protein